MTDEPQGRVVYGPARAGQLRYLLYGAVAAGVVLTTMGGVGLAYADVVIGIYLGLPGLIMIGFSIAGLVHLPQRRVLAKLLCVMTASLLVVMGLVLVRSLLGLLLVGTGIWMLVLSVRRDDELA